MQYAVVVGAPLLIVAFAWRQAVIADEEGLTIRLFGTKRFAWCDIEDFRPDRRPRYRVVYVLFSNGTAMPLPIRSHHDIGEAEFGHCLGVLKAWANHTAPQKLERAELLNVANLPITLYPGMKIGQVSFLQMTTAADVPYGSGRGSKYRNQRGPTPSRY